MEACSILLEDALGLIGALGIHFLDCTLQFVRWGGPEVGPAGTTSSSFAIIALLRAFIGPMAQDPTEVTRVLGLVSGSLCISTSSSSGETPLVLKLLDWGQDQSLVPR